MQLSIINIVVCTIFVFSTKINASFLDWGAEIADITQTFTGAKDECMNVNNISPAEIQNIDRSLAFTREQKCYMACVYKYLGMMSVGRFNPDGFIKMIPDQIWETDKTGLMKRFISFGQQCNQELNKQFAAGKASDECEIAGLITRCYNKLENSGAQRHSG